jgi:hypothetical protein
LKNNENVIPLLVTEKFNEIAITFRKKLKKNIPIIKIMGLKFDVNELRCGMIGCFPSGEI